VRVHQAQILQALAIQAVVMIVTGYLKMVTTLFGKMDAMQFMKKELVIDY
jgi:hypothetical protein